MTPARGARGNGWPLYFSTVDIETPRIVIRKGQLFPWQDKATIKGCGAAAGCPDSWRLPFSQLPYVETLDARTWDLAQAIYERNLTIDAAREMVVQR